MYSEYEMEIREKKIDAQRFLIDTLKAVNKKVKADNKNQAAEIERLKNGIEEGIRTIYKVEPRVKSPMCEELLEIAHLLDQALKGGTEK